jgi:two-component system, NtrC family, nitrogen regulation response regulator GlnG
MARILVVEPDRRLRQFIAGILADFGHRVEQCDDARTAGRWLDRAEFDVMATDLVLADGDGVAFPSVAAGLPVLTFSGRRFRPDDAKHERPARLRDKPFRFADLTALVSAILFVAAQNPGVGGN